jgi:acyl-CoA synthetase (AMP-forming)/AMP-acid ligase II
MRSNRSWRLPPLARDAFAKQGVNNSNPPVAADIAADLNGGGLGVQITTLTELLEFRARRAPDRRAFQFIKEYEGEHRQLTYRELYRRACGVARELKACGLEGERALLLYPAGLDFIVAFFGCLLARVVAVPAYPPRKNHHAERLDAIVLDAQAAAVLTSTEALERIENVVSPQSTLRRLPWLATDALQEVDSQGLDLAAPDSSSLAFLQYTSGSTGHPKGVVLTHGNLMANLARIAEGFGTSDTDICVSWLPLYHDMGLIGGILQPLYAGIDTTLLAPATFLQRPFSWLQALSGTKATISGGPNFAYELCAARVTDEQLSQLDLSHWEVAFNGAEPVRAATLDRFARRFARCGFRREAFYPCYGMAESTLLVSGGRRTHPSSLRRVSAG